MPSTSRKMQQLMAIAEHHPAHVFARHRGVLRMTRHQLHEFARARTSERRRGAGARLAGDEREHRRRPLATRP